MAKPKCPKCGNENIKHFSFTDRPHAHRRVKGFEKDVLLITASYQIEYQDGYEETQRLHCYECGNIILVSCKIEHVDD